MAWREAEVAGTVAAAEEEVVVVGTCVGLGHGFFHQGHVEGMG